MTEESLQKHFKSMGARVKLRSADTEAHRWRRPTAKSFIIDIKQDKRGEYFDILQGRAAPKLELLQVKPKEHHLLLYSRDGQRFLCGYDERHWFVAGVDAPVSTVRDAKASLIPANIQELVKGLSSKHLNRRRNAVFKRQGEWFFISVNRDVPEHLRLKDEPLQRTASSKPHICREIYREGGELVYIVGGAEMTKAEYTRHKKDPSYDFWNLRMMMRNPEVYARGYVRHADHATIKLDCWHRVFINAESMTSAVSFLD